MKSLSGRGTVVALKHMLRCLRMGNRVPLLTSKGNPVNGKDGGLEHPIRTKQTHKPSPESGCHDWATWGDYER